MVVLGIDPGMERCGYGVVVAQRGRLHAADFGVVTTTSSTPTAQRLWQLFTALRGICDAHQPLLIAVERLYFNRNVSSAMAVGQARGVALLVAAERGLPVEEYTPPQVKQAVSGYGGADKNQVQRMVRTILAIGAKEAMRDDAADALAIALCGYFRSDWERKAR